MADLGAFNWTPDGAAIVVEVGHGTAAENRDIGLVSLDSSGSWTRLLDTEAREISPAISPDGRWIAYSSDETGRFELYVRRFPELDQRQTISTNGGHSPWWSSDGQELYYLLAVIGPPVAMMAVPVESTDPALRPGQPEELFAWQYLGEPGPLRRYDRSPIDGRFLVRGSAASASSPGSQPNSSARLTVVLSLVRRAQSTSAGAVVMRLNPGTTLGPYEIRVYPGFPIRLGALPGFVVGDLMWKALWKFVENEPRFPRRGGRVLCVHGAVNFHRARPCARPVCRPGRHEGSLEAYRQNCDESGLQMSPPGPLRRHDLPDRGQPRYPCADSEPFAYPVR